MAGRRVGRAADHRRHRRRRRRPGAGDARLSVHQRPARRGPPPRRGWRPATPAGALHLRPQRPCGRRAARPDAQRAGPDRRRSRTLHAPRRHHPAVRGAGPHAIRSRPHACHRLQAEDQLTGAEPRPHRRRVGVREMNKRIRDLSIGRKLVLVTSVTCAVAVILALAIFIGLDVPSFQRTLATDLSTTAAMVGANSTAALAFNDEAAAKETLSALAAKERVQAGCLYGPDSRLLASYRPAASDSVCPDSAPTEGQRSFLANRMTVV